MCISYIGKVVEDTPIYREELDNDSDGFCHQRNVKWLFDKKSVNKKFMTSRVYDSFKGQSTVFATHIDDIEELVEKKPFLFIGSVFLHFI